MPQLKLPTDPHRAFRPENLIPTVTIGQKVHAVIKSRKRIESLCNAVNEPQSTSRSPWRQKIILVTDDPMGWVNCKSCVKKADRWMNLLELAPPSIKAQPNNPDHYFAEMSKAIEASQGDERRLLWLVLADYFDERGDLRGQFIRLACEITQAPAWGEHPLRRVQLINQMWRIDEEIYG